MIFIWKNRPFDIYHDGWEPDDLAPENFAKDLTPIEQKRALKALDEYYKQNGLYDKIWVNAGVTLVLEGVTYVQTRNGSFTVKETVNTQETVAKPAGEIYTKGYKPQPGERTLEGFMNNNISIDKEIPLHTNSPGFNNNSNGVGGQFKRFGVDSHGGVQPHVHQPTRNVAPNGNTYGGTGSKTSNGGVTPPTTKDIKQLYDYLFNGKYKP